MEKVQCLQLDSRDWVGGIIQCGQRRHRRNESSDRKIEKGIKLLSVLSVELSNLSDIFAGSG